MREELLAYLWKTQQFSPLSLQTTDGTPLVVVKPGYENPHAGPDFFQAHIQLGQTLWVGHVEIHVRASDWYNHRHEIDSSYDNVILHVVWDHDVPVFDASQQPMPTLCLADYAPKNITQKYEQWLTQKTKWILCADNIHLIKKLTKTAFFERLYVERLMEKTTLFQSWLSLTQNNWEAVFFVALAKGFGLKQNGLPFAQMALSIPWKSVLQSAQQVETLEALFMGQLGLFEQSSEHNYYQKQRKSYAYLKHKYSLTPVAEQVAFFRLRPPNFPTIRLAQLAWLVHHTPRLFSNTQKVKTDKEWYRLLDAKTSPFWEEHYHFNTPSKKRSHQLTPSFKQLLLLNTIFPFLFQYYSYTGDKKKEQIVDWVRQLPFEKNSYTTRFKEMGVTIEDALDSQACIQLKTTYCDMRRCLHCPFGHQLLNL